MPEVEPDAFVITDEQTRALLNALLDKWSSPSVARLFAIISRRIANRCVRRTNATKRYFTTVDAYRDVLDRAGSIFIERLPATILTAVAQALDDLADAAADAAVNELPKPARKRRKEDQPAILVWFNSVALVRAILVADEEMLSQSFVASLYYWRCDTSEDGAVVTGWNRYRSLPQAQRDSRLRTYLKLLRDKGLKYKDIETVARRIVAAPIE